MSKREGTVVVDLYEQIVISGASYCFKDPKAAEAQSRKVTTNPGIKTLWSGYADFFLACGDDYIKPGGQRWTHYYGRGGRYINYVIQRDA